MGIGGKSPGAEAGAAREVDPDEYGHGDYDPETGLYEWYELPEEVTAPQALTWIDLLGQWDLIEADLHEHYGIDTATGILAARDGRWIRTRIAGLLLTDSRLHAYVVALKKPQDQPEGS